MDAVKKASHRGGKTTNRSPPIKHPEVHAGVLLVEEEILKEKGAGALNLTCVPCPSGTFSSGGGASLCVLLSGSMLYMVPIFSLLE